MLTKARAAGLLGVSALAVAGCGGSAARHHHGAEAGRTECPAKALRAVPDPSISVPTDQLAIVFILRNVKGVACSLQAIPRIALYGQRGAELRFGYRRASASGGRWITIDPHSRVYLEITKHPCTLHATALAGSLGLGLARSETLHLRLGAGGAFDYCPASDPSGHVVHVLPLARSLKTLLPGA